MSREKNLATLEKIYARVQRGATDNEKQNAQTLLTKLLEKYDVTLDEVLETTSIQEYSYKYYDSMELSILTGVNYRVFGESTMTYNQKAKRAFVKCTLVQWMDFKEHAETLIKAFRVEMKNLKQTALYAFLHKQNLLNDGKEESNGCDSGLSPQQIRDILDMSKKMDKINIHKKLNKA